MPQERLLEDLAKNQNCFISSLRGSSEQKKAYLDLLQFDPAKYDLEEWDYCISYLTGHELQFPNVKAAKEFIKQTVLSDNGPPMNKITAV